ncbi:MAG: Macrolide export ATP-binding/permease protein MacB [bacterium ADurb.Bin374]|nr:MAG: Macrolide export ATP-binding/permease protein MacB [bacterium ADurb.Bin374]
MNLWGVVRLALISIARNKMRSFLTALGIIIGVGSVVTMVGVGQGAYASVQNEISKMGTSLIMIMPGSSSSGGARMGMGTMTTLTEADADAIAADCSSLSMVSAVVRTSGPMVYANQNWSTQVMGVGIDYLDIRASKVTVGRYFTDQEVRNGAKVCVLGKVVADNLFGSINPIGRTIRIKKMPFEVVGVLEERGQSGPGQDQDDVALAPLETVKRRMMGITHINMIMASAVSDDAVDEAKEEIANVLRRRHRLTDNQDDDFQIRTQADIAAMAGSTLGIITLLLGAIASVSLVVGGIGIMNIMLVSVTERTREIGIRMAIGARARDILTQFLVESVTLSCVGGLLGILLGMGLTNIISRFTEWQVYVSIPAMIIAVTFSAAVGIFFGLYPAWKASQLDPIEALRFE